MPLEHEQTAREAVEHVYGYLLDHIRSERRTFGLSAAFEFVCLVQAYSAPQDTGQRFINDFMDGQPVVLPCGSGLFLTRDRDALYDVLSSLYAKGERDTSFVDYSRSDATLLHIHNVHRKSP